MKSRSVKMSTTPMPGYSKASLSVNDKDLDYVYVKKQDKYQIEGKDLTNEEFITIWRERAKIKLTKEEIMNLPPKLRKKVIALAAIESL
tara:strand:- start:739 stop:1005 length:267 start_codon:yes stop_codon:yes gene_type:complete